MAWFLQGVELGLYGEAVEVVKDSLLKGVISKDFVVRFFAIFSAVGFNTWPFQNNESEDVVLKGLSVDPNLLDVGRLDIDLL